MTVDAPPPGTGIPLPDQLEDACPDCDGDLRVVDPFYSLASSILVDFLEPADREQVEGIVELHCRECGYVGSAQREVAV